MNLVLHLKRKQWEQIRDGIKVYEYRRATDYWKKRLVGREYDEVHLLLGYPKRGDTSRLLRRRWNGVATGVHVLCEELGDKFVRVFGINVSEACKGAD